MLPGSGTTELSASPSRISPAPPRRSSQIHSVMDSRTPMRILDAANGLRALRTAARILLDDWVSAPAQLSFRGCLLLKTKVVTGKYALRIPNIYPEILHAERTLSTH